MKKISILAVILLILDLGTKLLAEQFLTADGSFLVLHYNPNMIMGIEGNDFFKFVAPLLGFPILLYGGIQILNNTIKTWYLSLIIAGAVGNVSGRFSEEGVVDFINLGFAICNIADIYMWIALILFFKAGERRLKSQEHKGKT